MTRPEQSKARGPAAPWTHGRPSFVRAMRMICWASLPRGVGFTTGFTIAATTGAVAGVGSLTTGSATGAGSTGAGSVPTGSTAGVRSVAGSTTGAVGSTRTGTVGSSAAAGVAGATESRMAPARVRGMNARAPMCRVRNGVPFCQHVALGRGGGGLEPTNAHGQDRSRRGDGGARTLEGMVDVGEATRRAVRVGLLSCRSHLTWRAGRRSGVYPRSPDPAGDAVDRP